MSNVWDRRRDGGFDDEDQRWWKTLSDDDRLLLLREGYAPGDYYAGECMHCGTELESVDKRARVCRSCAESRAFLPQVKAWSRLKKILTK